MPSANSFLQGNNGPPSASDFLSQETTQPQSSVGGAALRGAERGVLPAAGALTGAEIGAAGGGAIGGPVGALAGGLVGGAGGYFGGEQFNKGLENLLPKKVLSFIGQTPEQQQADVSQHPLATQLGEIAPATIPGGALASEAAKAVPRPIESVAQKSPTVGKYLPGATRRAQETVTQVGVPENMNDIGTAMSEKARAASDKVTSARTEFKNKALSDLYAQPSDQVLHDFRVYYNNVTRKRGLQYMPQYLQGTVTRTTRDLTGDKIKLLNFVNDELAGDKSMQAVYDVRNRLNDIANSGQWEGYAGDKAMASEIRNVLDKIIDENTGGRLSEFNKKYASLSEPVNIIRKGKVGRALTADESAFVEDLPKTDPINLPKKVFSSETNVNTYRRIVGDDAFVNDMAARYVASSLKNITVPQVTKIHERLTQRNAAAVANAARKWLGDAENSWLTNQAGLGKVRMEAERYVDRLESNARRQVHEFAAGTVGLAALAEALGFNPLSIYRWIMGRP